MLFYVIDQSILCYSFTGFRYLTLQHVSVFSFSGLEEKLNTFCVTVDTRNMTKTDVQQKTTRNTEL